MSERVLVRKKINDDKQPRLLVEWAPGHKDADIITLKTEVFGTTGRGSTVPKDAVFRMIMNFRTLSEDETNKNQGCKVVWRANMESKVILGRKHTFDSGVTILPSLFTDTLWTVKFDADGKVLKRHEHDDKMDPRDSQAA